jgi:hypothetical protein
MEYFSKYEDLPSDRTKITAILYYVAGWISSL